MTKIIHVDNISIPLQYSPSDTKHFLPFHQPTFLENMFCIMNNFIVQDELITLMYVPDSNLGTNSNSSDLYYEQIIGIEIESIDNKNEHLKNTLEYGSKLLNYFHSLQHTIQTVNTQYGSLTVRQSLWKVQTKVSEVLERQNKIKQVPVIGYNFINKNRSHYAMVGVNKTKTKHLPTLLANFRMWNLNRLSIHSSINEIQPDRIHKIIQHLFVSGRTFIRKSNDDFNTYETSLTNLANQIITMIPLNVESLEDITEREGSNLAIPFQKMVLKCFSYQIVYQSVVKEQFWTFVAEAVTTWLTQTPVNLPCSYSSALKHDEKLNTINIVLLSLYDRAEEKNITEKQLTSSMAKMQGFLKSQNYPQNTQIRVGSVQDVFRKSMLILNKYHHQEDIPQLSESYIGSFSKLDDRSRISTSSFLTDYRTQKNKPTSMQKIMKLQNNFYQLLKALEKQPKLLTPTQLQINLKNYLNQLEKKYQSYPGFQSLSKNERDMLISLLKIGEILEVQEMEYLLKNNLNQVQCIMQALMQNNTYGKIIDLATSIGRESLETLYSQSIQNGLQNEKHCLLIFILKKILIHYNEEIKWKTLYLDEVSIPQLIQMLQTKQYTSSLYSSMVKVVFPHLFQHSQSPNPIQAIAPVLNQYYSLLLGRSHHQELVHTFMCEVLFEVCYFHEDGVLNSLSNYAYREEGGRTVKEKKILQMLREGGFRGTGYQMKTTVLPFIQEHRTYQPDYPILKKITIKKPLLIKHFIKVLLNCHYTSTFIEIINFYKHNPQLVQSLKTNRKYLIFVLRKEIQDFRMEVKDEDEEEIDFEEIDKSESGIFLEISRMNPKVKIAGIEVSRMVEEKGQLHKKQKQEKKTFKALQKGQAVLQVLEQDINEGYELIDVALALKEKYLRYHLLHENQKSYFRDCVNGLLQNKHKILHYLSLNTQIVSLVP